MKKLLLLITGLLLLFSVEGQILRYSNYTAPPSGDEYTTQFQAVLDDFTWSYGADTLGWMNDMVYSLDSAGYWDNHMELFYLFAVNNTADAKLNWVSPGTYDLTDPGSTAPAIVKYQGYDAAGDDYLSAGWNPSTDAANVGLTDITIASWQLPDIDGNYYTMGAYDGTRSLALIPASGTRLRARLFNTNSQDLGSVASSTGFSMATARGVNDIEGYYNGSSTGTTAITGAALTNQTLWVLANNNNGSIQYGYDGIVSIILIMDGVTDDDATNIYNIIHRFLTRMGL